MMSFQSLKLSILVGWHAGAVECCSVLQYAAVVLQGRFKTNLWPS